MHVFLTGTDTGAGKTYVASRWVRSLRSAGVDAVGMKPICCGDRDDATALHAASEERISLNQVNPVWLRPAAAPYVASMIEQRNVDLDLILSTFRGLRAAHPAVVVEGVGGWRVPIRRDYFVSDLAADMGLPVAIVVGNRLGAINHALLTIESVRLAGLECAGLVLTRTSNDDDPAAITNPAILEELAGVPILAQLDFGQEELKLPPTVL